MTQPERGPVVIDTGVFGARLTRGTKSLAAAYRPLRDGRPAIISFVTVAELRFGAKLAGWGQTRLQQLEHELDQADTVWPGPSLAEAYATLLAWCVKAGHGLGQNPTKPTVGWPRQPSGSTFRSSRTTRSSPMSRTFACLPSSISMHRERVPLCSVPVPSDADQDRQTTPTSENRKRRSRAQWPVT